MFSMNQQGEEFSAFSWHVIPVYAKGRTGLSARNYAVQYFLFVFNCVFHSSKDHTIQTDNGSAA